MAQIVSCQTWPASGQSLAKPHALALQLPLVLALAATPEAADHALAARDARDARGAKGARDARDAKIAKIAKSESLGDVAQ